MSGENPDGSHYEDPGIMWVSYFNGGDALHAFDRPSYGCPQSLGCVEMRLEDAAESGPTRRSAPWSRSNPDARAAALRAHTQVWNTRGGHD